MNNRMILGSLIFLFTVGLALAAVPVIQDHSGGLGEKKIPLNIADVTQLMKIDGVTPVLARGIVEYRKKLGFFKAPEDLLKVPGLTKEIYKKMNPKVGTEGELYCVPKAGLEDEEEEDIPLAPSKC
jgi:competence ComEA-like helix-hairpin-helix protein